MYAAPTLLFMEGINPCPLSPSKSQNAIVEPYGVTEGVGELDGVIDVVGVTVDDAVCETVLEGVVAGV
jgi:hypothetical protein